jgi:hypothetical protein
MWRIRPISESRFYGLMGDSFLMIITYHKTQLLSRILSQSFGIYILDGVPPELKYEKSYARFMTETLGIEMVHFKGGIGPKNPTATDQTHLDRNNLKGGDMNMLDTLTDSTRQALYIRARGQCECTMTVCRHHVAGMRCPNRLAKGHWEAHRKIAGGSYSLSNLVAMCESCHENTRSYGRH